MRSIICTATPRRVRCLPVLLSLFLGLISSLYAIPFDARLNAVVADPSEPNRLYASSIGGLLKSEDRGKTWQQIPVYPLGQRQPGFAKVQFDQANPATIYAYASGDLSSPLSGIWRSNDHGAHWQHLTPSGTFMEGSELDRLLVAPSNGSVLYAVTKAGGATRTYRSDNGGSTWTFATQREVLAIHPKEPLTIFDGGVYQIYRSIDGGANWRQIGQTKDASGGLNGINGIAISPANPQLMITNVGGSSSNSVGIFRSTNGGTSWEQIRTGSAVGGSAFNPYNPTQVIVGDCCSLDLLYSNDSGRTFQAVNGRSTNADFPNRLTLSPSNVSFDPSPGGFLLHGVASTNNNGGIAEIASATASWKRLQGTYTPSAAVNAEVTSAKVLSDDSSILTNTLRIVGAEGSTSPGVTLRGEPTVSNGVTVVITKDGSDPESPVIEMNLRRSAKGLAPGVYAATVEVPINGALNDKVLIPTRFEALERPETPGVSLGRALPPGSVFSVYGLAKHGNDIYIGGFGQLDVLQADGTLRRVAGKGYGNSGEGGPALDAQIGFLGGIAVAPNGTVYFVDTFNYVVKAVSPDGILRTVAGSEGGSSSISTEVNQISASNVRIGSGVPLATRSDGSLLLGISGRVWRLDGSTLRAITGTSTRQSPAGGLQAQNAYFPTITGIMIDENGLLVIASRTQVFRVNSGSTLEHLAGTPSPDLTSQDARKMSFTIESFTMHNRYLYVLDEKSGVVKRIDPDFSVRSVAFNGVMGTASGCSGSLYVPSASSTTAGMVMTDGGILHVGQTGLPRFWLPVPNGNNGPTPSVPAEGIVNAASFGPAISPGSLASVFGSDVASELIAAPALPLPAQLGGGVACVDSQVAPQIFASPLQLNVQVPYGIEAGTRSARFFNAHGGTAPVPVQVQASSPEVFRDQNGRGIIVNPDGSLNGPGSGASPGQYVIVYLTGTGDVEPAVPTGAASPADALSRPKQDYRITVGGADRDLYFLGLTPGFAGLAQANLEVPQLSPGEHNLTITVGGHTSQTVKLTVK